MQTISGNNYDIFFGAKGYESLATILLPSHYSKIFILVDENTSQYCLPYFLSNLATDIEIEIIELEAGELHKNITTCTEVWGALSELRADRKSIVLNLGGGVISDLGGFVACTFMRGIDFITIPTTLLSMVDAAIGGKNGVDLEHLKNQIGLIREPKAVIIDTQFLSTLPANEMRSGLAEMLKHGLIYDAEHWNKFKNLKTLNTDYLEELIHRSIQIKNEIVLQDIYESNVRKVLNFGHTLGHAIESYFLAKNNETTLLHGEAVAAGMILESFLSKEQKLLSQEDYQEIKYIINELFERISFSNETIATIIDLLHFDKKNTFGEIQFVLLEKIGTATINRNVDKTLIYKAFEDYKC
ncbi:3-dehydroquinate synthase [Flavobacterium sp.]|jgi:3-dehydroquinate synthase|uniref:3-dehydroquinate synthase n=1 Tax=Flavobacterium sp. TaxID=239 RepID=UPI0037BFC1F0